MSSSTAPGNETGSGTHEAWLDDILACPRCRGEVRRRSQGYACAACDVVYPVRFGIPDFRLQPDPYIPIDDEVSKTRALLATEDRSFRGLLRRYYELSPENPPRLADHYLRAMQQAEVRGDAFVRKLLDRFPGSRRTTLLDLGCGTAGMVSAGSRRYQRVVGVDVALRWLAIGRRRLEEAGTAAPLVCANAEHLPFRNASFDALVSDAVLEHVREPLRVVDESLRALTPGGVFFFSTNNRFSLLPEPHLRLWGFGFLPRRWMRPLASWVRKTPYEARLLSRRELRRLFHGVGRVTAPYFDAAELHLPPVIPKRLWMRFGRLRPVRTLAAPFLPLFFVFGSKPAGGPGSGA